MTIVRDIYMTCYKNIVSNFYGRYRGYVYEVIYLDIVAENNLPVT